MSYPVRVVVKETIRETVSVDDEIRIQVCDDPILARPDARDTLHAELESHGWERDNAKAGADSADVWVRRFDDGTVVSWDIDEHAVTISSERESELTREETVRAHGDAWRVEDRPGIEQELRERAKEELEERAKQVTSEARKERERLLDEVQAQLETHVDDVIRDVAQVQEDFYKTWVKEQAGKMGTITSQTEHESADGSTYELTIRIDA